MIYLFTQTNIKYENDFSVVEKGARTVKATGNWIKERSYEIDKANNTFTFFMKDKSGREMKVVYAGSIPNNFESATNVVVTGRYSGGCFHASNVLTKCPSKYEGTPNINTSVKSSMN
jgi:cytochrome c-type biogenesis protein CcmE